MASLWEAPQEIVQQVKALQGEHHEHLSLASIWVLCSDAKCIRDNRLIVTTTQKCTKTERLSSGHDFKITILMEAWAQLTDPQRAVALDEALCRCGVKYRPKTVEVNGKKEVLKDDLGRVIHTDQIEYDRENRPKWKVNAPDAGLFFDLLARHGEYGEEAENATRALAGKPLKLPVAVESADVVDTMLDEKIPA